MLHRIVRMEFSEATKDEFSKIFYAKKPFIETFDGCESVELMEDQDNPLVLYTLSIWQADDFLQQYRQSPLFIETWKNVKPLFSAKAQAFSLIKHQQDDGT